MSIAGIFPIDEWIFDSGSALNALAEEDYNRLMINSSLHTYKKGEIIFREGTVPSGIFLVHAGKVKKYKTDHLGKQQIIYIAKAKELIGYHAVLSEERYPDSAAAIENCMIYFIPAVDFMFIIKKCPLFALRLIKILSHDIKVLSNSISVLGQRTATERLAIALIVLREKYKEEDEDFKKIYLTISRSDLAYITGIAKENVVRILKDFKQEGLIETDGHKIKITDIKLLIKRANYR
ncbi:Crp/Fnr family transcriptional regulator [Mucilaginibacter sp. KACC 22063]|uniref:Crp/Fnr family transcriptional regulator n=1 Tax=Mucilaginibacter sp. KACC 22063 TaxID=3025666 RepID=UPI0023665034|nr:Crp/Fnr family transcriptional regulator [Mucilaginibacter sp. KACC 22063]WDF55098.1 Crp/Fnr family transcriptional regulator [Mucilaginibacter sp. KACC 22063]